MIGDLRVRLELTYGQLRPLMLGGQSTPASPQGAPFDPSEGAWCPEQLLEDRRMGLRRHILTHSDLGQTVKNVVTALLIKRLPVI
jgi:hypothetical protein